MTFDGQPVLLMHGDTLCTDDKDYQQFRGLVRSSSWQTGFLAQAPAARMQQAAEYRQQSQAMTAIKSNDIMDVNSGTVEHLLAVLIIANAFLCRFYSLQQKMIVIKKARPRSFG